MPISSRALYQFPSIIRNRRHSSSRVPTIEAKRLSKSLAQIEVCRRFERRSSSAPFRKIGDFDIFCVSLAELAYGIRAARDVPFGRRHDLRPMAPNTELIMVNQSKRVDIIPAKRHAMILDWLRTHSTASIQDLMNGIPASASTIRRDLDYLTQVGYIQRTHGGATLRPETSATFEIESSILSHIAHPQKAAIGKAAADLIEPHDSLLLDSSTTVLEAVKEIVKRQIPFTAITNGLEIALLCSKSNDVRVMMPGGSVRPGYPFLIGEPGLEFLRTVHADVCLIGTHSISENILTNVLQDVAFLKRAMIKASRRRILLADSSKFRAPGLFTFADLSEMNELVTDDGASAEQLASVRAAGVKVVAAAVADNSAENDQEHFRS